MVRKQKIQRLSFATKFLVLVFVLILNTQNAQRVFASTTIGANITTEGNLTADGALKFTSGATNNYILTTDTDGNATWISVSDALGDATTDDLAEGVINLFYTDDRADDRIEVQKGENNGLATLDNDGKVLAEQLPTLVITNVYAVADIAARDALADILQGDVAVVTDAGGGESRSYIFDGAVWLELKSPEALSLYAANNLSDLADAGEARTNLGLGETDLPTFDGLTITSYIDFTPAVAPAYTEGRLFYDSDTQTLSYYNSTTDSQVHLGEDVLVKVKNTSGGTINKGQVVYFNGSDGDVPTVDLAQANAIATSEAVAVATTNIGAGDIEHVTVFGLIYDMDTSIFTAGDTIFLSSDTLGALTSTRPVQPNFTAFIGKVVTSDPLLGVIQVQTTSMTKFGAYTQGAVAFGGSDGFIKEDASEFFWDIDDNRLGIGDITPLATLTVGDGDLFEVFGDSGNITTQGDVTLTTGGGVITATDGGLTVLGGGASSFSTSTGALTLQPAGALTTALVQIGAGGAGSATPDFLALDVKSDTGDPVGGAEGYVYYNTFDNKFRCYENAAWKDCDTTGGGGSGTLQDSYDNGATITTSGATDIALTLTSGDFTATGAGSMDLTPTGASSFTSGGALTLTAGAASTWSTSSGNLTLEASALTGDLILTGGEDIVLTGFATCTALETDGSGNLICGSDAVGGGGGTLNDAYGNGATITTSGADIVFTLSSGDFNVTGTDAVNLTPTAASQFTSGGALTFTAGAASTWGTTVGDLTLQASGSGATANIQIGTGGVGNTTPDFLALAVKSDTSDPIGGAEGYMYYNTFDNKFRCYENATWKDCDTTGGTVSLQSAYNNGATITTAGAIDMALTLASGDFTASGAGSVDLTPTGASSFTSGGALTFTAGAASVWSTSSGALTVDSAAALNLGTASATSVSIGQPTTTVTINGYLAVPNYIDITTSGNPAYAEGRLFYDDTEKTLAYYNDVSGEEVRIGRQYVLRIYNQTGVQINKGQAVYIDGVFSDNPSVDLARADVEATARAVGIASQNIANASYGYVVTRGLVTNLNTSSFSEGDALYLSPSTAGALTATRPTEPNFSIPIGYVVKSNATTGIILTEIVSRVWPGSYVAGGISFAGSNEFLTTDNSNLFWDDTNNRLGIEDNTPTASLVVGSGDLFQVFAASGNITTQGDITLGTGGGSISATGGGLTLSGAGASSFSTTTGALTLQVAGTGTISTVQIGVGGVGSATPDFLGLDVKSTTGDPVGGAEGYVYYNTFDNKFRCYQDLAWTDCIGTASVGSGTTTNATLRWSGAAWVENTSVLITSTGDVEMRAQGDARFYDSDSSNYVALQSPASVGTNFTWTLPSADGTSGQLLSTNGSGTLSFTGTVPTTGFMHSVRKSADETYPGAPAADETVLQNDNELTFSIGASETWNILFYTQVSESSNNNIKYSVTAPAGATCDVSVNGFIGDFSSAGNGCGVEIPNVAIATATTEEQVITASVANGVTPGSVTLQWAQNSGTSATVTVYQGSFLQAFKVN